MFSIFKKLYKSHLLVYDNYKQIFYDRVSIFIALFFVIIGYSLIIDKKLPSIQILTSLSIVALISVYMLDYFIFPFIINKIFGHDISGTWKVKFIVEQPKKEKKKEKSGRLEINIFGRRCLIYAETEEFIGTSLVAKLTTKEDGSIEIKYIYKTIYKERNKPNHYGMAKITFLYGNNPNVKNIKGDYYSRDEGILRYGQIKFEERIN